MWPRHRLDIGVGDLVHGLGACLLAYDAERLEAEVLQLAGLTGRGLVTFSVRSGWDLVLTALDWAPGDEVIVSAITHPDMAALLRVHGLRVVPVDLDPRTLAPAPADLERALSPRTRAVLVAQLFGGRVDLTPLVAFTRAYGLLLVEDAAQACTGPASLGPTAADVSLHSFGLIKTASAAGGALVSIRDPALLTAVRRGQQGWPVQGRGAYAARLLKVAVLRLLGHPGVYGAYFGLCTALRVDPDRLVNAATRSFTGAARAAQPDLLTRVRRRPCPALVALLRRRLRRFDAPRLARRAAAGEALTAVLPPGLSHPGGALTDRTHWLYPVVAAEPGRLVTELRRRGLDASRATSNLSAIGAADAAPPPQADQLLRSVVYLPAYPELPAAARAELVAVLQAAAERRT